MLVEAKDQVAHGSWTRWLTGNFALSRATAARYMQLARLANADDPKWRGAASIEEALDVQPRRERHAVWGTVRDATDRVNVAPFAEARQARGWPHPTIPNMQAPAQLKMPWAPNPAASGMPYSARFVTPSTA
jgi:Protein of unknown function (DUF3102)